MQVPEPFAEDLFAVLGEEERPDYRLAPAFSICSWCSWQLCGGFVAAAAFHAAHGERTAAHAGG